MKIKRNHSLWKRTSLILFTVLINGSLFEQKTEYYIHLCIGA